MSQGPPTSGGGVDPQQPPAEPAVPAGWYAHPSAPGWEAYWDGAGWGVETRPAQAAAAAAPVAEEAAPVAQDPAAVAQDPAAVAQDPAAAQQPYADPAPVEQDPAAVQQPYADPAAAPQDPAAAPQEPVPAQQPYEDPATAVQAQQPYDPQAAQYAQEQPPAAVPSAAAAGTAAVAAAPAAVPASTSTYDPATPVDAESTRSDSSLPLILCLLGAIVAIVGCFLPMATVDGADAGGLGIADNTLFAAGYGIAVIALAVIAAGVASYFYLKGRSTWIVILLGVVIVGIAAYVGLAGLDSLDPELPEGLTTTGNIGQDAIDKTFPAIDGSPSTGIFVAGLGGLIVLLGGIGISRQPK